MGIEFSGGFLPRRMKENCVLCRFCFSPLLGGCRPTYNEILWAMLCIGPTVNTSFNLFSTVR
jgi:hypothetical protein